MRIKILRTLSSSPARTLKVTFAFLLLGCMAFFAPPSRADNLHYFKNYFVTGDYTVAGVGLFGKGVNGLATGTIDMSGANGAPATPAGADIVAAFLYWQTIETTATPSLSNGNFDGNPVVGDAIGYAKTPSCWSQGGSAPNAYARVYRADVLRYLPVNSALDIRVANAKHTVQLPDSGNALTSVTPHTQGATLVVVYRMLPLGAASYKAVVIYDGAVTMSKFDEFSQTMGGFYGANNTSAKMTHIVGNGQPNFSVQLKVNNGTRKGVASTIFSGAQGARWDNPTFNISLAKGAASLNTIVDPENNQVCLSWSAMVMSTDVIDSDGDGLLDSWEIFGLHLNVGTRTYPNPIPATFGGCLDYPKDPCENFPAMGAFYLKKDIFVQIDWMSGSNNGYAHVHSPKFAGLKMIGDAFWAQGITAHFDVGNRYQGLPYIIPYKTLLGTVLAKGGNVIQESTLECPNLKVPLAANCAFPQLTYSAMSWKKGFDAVKNGFNVLGIPQYFPHDRKDSFHYILFGHALAVSKAPNPQVPLSVSGVADTPGGDLLVTLGLWPADDPKVAPNNGPCVPDDPTGKVLDANLCINQTGTSIQQAGTVMHELGHNMGLYHGGSVKIPNCKPDYPSVMNYLYQTRGLTDLNGNEQIDFSYGLLGQLNESALFENQSLGALMKYRIRFYAPANQAEIAANSQATAHCDGSPTNGTMEIRTEAPALGTPDWENDGDPIPSNTDGTATSVDINFDGTVGGVFTDYNDWIHLNFQQVGGRLNVDGLSADISASDLGQSDLGQSDLGQSDLGQSDLGQSDLGQSDLGQSDLGQSDLGDVDYKTVVSTLDATGPNTPLVATVKASTGTAYNEVTFSWGAPTVGQIRTYYIWRENMSVAPASRQFVNTAYMQVNGAPPATTFIDPVNDFTLADSGANCPATKVCYNANYQYFITAQDINGTISAPSNFVTATVDHIFVTSYSGSVIYGNTLPNLTTSATISGLPAGALTTSSAGFSCTNTTGSVPPRNVGNYTTSCTGPATVGTGNVYGVTYNADTTGTLTITQRPLTITAQPNTKLYDGLTSANAIPVPAVGTATSGAGLVNGDTAVSVETYDNRNAGTGKTLSVMAVVVGDGNGGGNYAPITTVPNTAGIITQRPLTIAAVTNTKTYDRSTSASAVPTPVTATGTTGLVSGDTVTGTAETYDNRNAGNGKTLSVSAYAVNDGNNGANYSPVTLTTNTTGVIYKRSLTITAVTNTKTNDGTILASATPTYPSASGNSGLEPGDTITGLAETYASVNYGVEALSVSAYTVNDGNSGMNYTTSVVPVNGLINQRPLTIDAVTNTKAYDGNTTASAVPTVEAATGATGLVLTDSVSGRTEAYGSPNAGFETLSVTAYTVNDGNSGNNYSVSLIPANGKINPDPLTATVQESADMPPVFTASYVGFVNQETASVVSGTLSCAVSGTQDNSNNYPISCTGLSALNYNISYDYSDSSLSGIDAAIPAPLVVNVVGTTQLVSSTPTFTLTSVTYSGFVNGDAISVVNGTLSCAAQATADSSGNYPISCSGLSSANYTITYSYSPAPGPISVATAPLTVAVTGTQPVGGTPTYTVTYSGFLNGDTISVVTGTLSCNTDATTGSTAGSYAITSCTGLSAPGAYNVVYWLGSVNVM
jgi:hypothetical protein